MNSRSDGEKNNAIELLRFLFCCAVFLFHFREFGGYASSRAFTGGYLGVEFFFLTAGFLLYSHLSIRPARQSPVREALIYLKGRYVRLYPEYLISVLLLMGAKLLAGSISLTRALTRGLPDILALQAFIRPYSIGRPLWFVSALIWASAAVVFFLRFNEKVFLRFVVPAAVAALLFSVWRFGTVDVTQDRYAPVTLFRAFAEIGVGCELCVAFETLARWSRRIPEALRTAGETALFAGSLLILFLARQGLGDGAAILWIAALVPVFFLCRGGLSRIMDNGVSGFLGSLSYLMYLNQNTVMILTEKLAPDLPFAAAALLRLVLLMLLSWLIKLAFSAVRRKV